MNLHIFNCICRGIFIIVISLCISQTNADAPSLSSYIGAFMKLAKQVTTHTTSVIDPWVIDQRQAVSAALLNCTSIPALFGKDNIGNILWGLEIQRQWQVTSGRQQFKSSTRIDEHSWFADLNYFLTIVPYLAAMKINLVPQRKFLPPQSNSPIKFPITFETIDHQIAEQWKSFFEKIKILQTKPTFTVPEYLQKVLWIAHNTTVTKVLSTFKREMELQNHQERKFSNGFGHFLEILSIINLNTSYPQINMFSKTFPPRVLKPTDIPPLIIDMTYQQNTIISFFFAIDEMTKVPLIWTRLVETLRNGMTIVKCSVKLQKAINRFLASPNDGIVDVLLNIVNRC